LLVGSIIVIWGIIGPNNIVKGYRITTILCSYTFCTNLARVQTSFLAAVSGRSYWAQKSTL